MVSSDWKSKCCPAAEGQHKSPSETLSKLPILSAHAQPCLEIGERPMMGNSGWESAIIYGYETCHVQHPKALWRTGGEVFDSTLQPGNFTSRMEDESYIVEGEEKVRLASGRTSRRTMRGLTTYTWEWRGCLVVVSTCTVYCRLLPPKVLCTRHVFVLIVHVSICTEYSLYCQCSTSHLSLSLVDVRTRYEDSLVPACTEVCRFSLQS